METIDNYNYGIVATVKNDNFTKSKKLALFNSLPVAFAVMDFFRNYSDLYKSYQKIELYEIDTKRLVESIDLKKIV